MATDSVTPKTTHAEKLALETSVLRTLCLTVNSDTSNLKYKILDTLATDDFYFPVTRTIFDSIRNFHSNGDFIAASSLEEVLRARAIDIPADFFVEDLFSGELPSSEELEEWIARMQAQTAAAREAEPAGGDPVKELQKTRPSITPDPAITQPPPKQLSAAASGELAPTMDEPVSPPAPKAAPTASALAPESGEWLSYLSELTEKQGRKLETGFPGFDRALKGLSSGLSVLVDGESARRLDLLKQLVDQTTSRCDSPCLYLSYELDKAALRLRTLSRLSGAPSEDIESGKFEKDSPEWQSVVDAGKEAMGWLQRIFVVEASGEETLDELRAMVTQLPKPDEAPAVVAIDNVDRLPDATSTLRALADSPGVIVLAASAKPELTAELDADVRIRVGGANPQLVIEVSAKNAPLVPLRFEYQPERHRFSEAPSS